MYEQLEKELRERAAQWLAEESDALDKDARNEFFASQYRTRVAFALEEFEPKDDVVERRDYHVFCNELERIFVEQIREEGQMQRCASFISGLVVAFGISLHESTRESLPQVLPPPES